MSTQEVTKPARAIPLEVDWVNRPNMALCGAVELGAGVCGGAWSLPLLKRPERRKTSVHVTIIEMTMRMMIIQVMSAIVSLRQ